MRQNEDELLARMCSQPRETPLAVALAAHTEMFGQLAWPNGKTLSDCFFDLAAGRTKDQKADRSDIERGRISLSVAHWVGDDARKLCNVTGISATVFGAPVDKERWNLHIDTPSGWSAYGGDLRRAFVEVGRREELARIVVQFYVDEVLCNVMKVVEAAGRDAAFEVGTMAAVGRVLGSLSRYAYVDDYPQLAEAAGRNGDGCKAALDFYAAKNDRYAERAAYLRVILAAYRGPFDDGWGQPARRGQWAPVSTVRDAQQVLRILGFYMGRLDGDWGPKSQAAIMAWADESRGCRDWLTAPQGLLTLHAREQLSVVAWQHGIETLTMRMQS